MSEADARPRERPRDRFGRPLPWGSISEIALEDYASLSLEENRALGVAHFNAGRFFQAHEAWEESWRKAEGTDDEEFFKGLAQLGAAYTHYARGNAHGARVLLERALERIGSHDSPRGGMDIADALATFEQQRALFALAESGTPLAAIAPPTL